MQAMVGLGVASGIHMESMQAMLCRCCDYHLSLSTEALAAETPQASFVGGDIQYNRQVSLAYGLHCAWASYAV